MTIHVSGNAIKTEYRNAIEEMRKAAGGKNESIITIELTGAKDHANTLTVDCDCKNNYEISGGAYNGQVLPVTFKYMKYAMCSSFEDLMNKTTQSVADSGTITEEIKTTLLFYFTEAARSEIIFKYCEKNIEHLGEFTLIFLALAYNYQQTLEKRDGAAPRPDKPLLPDDYIRFFTDRVTMNGVKTNLKVLRMACDSAGIKIKK
jgi:hypothetical protein